uniref:Folate-biopterin transporter 2 n=1 Tax=Kalanchoe fedtschenkoi TaxID=63787 RepID=A0A7N0SV76_KALFE
MREEEERTEFEIHGDAAGEGAPAKGGCCGYISTPVNWLKMLSKQTHWSFVLGVIAVYGISQGLGGALGRIATEYYMKDELKVLPSEAQVYAGITSIPWIVKPLWGLLTDVLPIVGYRRRPYFIFAGMFGALSTLVLATHDNLHKVLAIACLTAGSAGVAIADVTIDACVAQNSIAHPSLASDLQSLCALSSSIGALVGFSFSGVFVDLIGPKGVFGLLVLPAGLVFLLGLSLNEPHIPDFTYRQVNVKFLNASRSMWTTLKCPAVWRPCLYMYLSLALSLNVHEGLFYWYTDKNAGPAFSQEAVGYISSIGSVGSLLGAVLYQYGLKDHPFREMLFWTQLLYGLSGMLDLILVLRLNLRLGLPDYLFIVMDESVSQLIGRLKWMPLLVLSTKLCPPGIEGTFFALLMSIDNAGLLSSSWGGGLLLQMLNVTRTRFESLWLAVLIRNVLRVTPLAVLFLVPRSDPNSSILPTDLLNMSSGEDGVDAQAEKNGDDIELAPLVSSR